LKPFLLDGAPGAVSREADRRTASIIIHFTHG